MAAWICFYDRKDVFRGFLERVLRLKEVCELTPRFLFLEFAIFMLSRLRYVEM